LVGWEFFEGFPAKEGRRVPRGEIRSMRNQEGHEQRTILTIGIKGEKKEWAVGLVHLLGFKKKKKKAYVLGGKKTRKTVKPDLS